MHGLHVNKLQSVFQDADARPAPEVCHDGACPLAAVICFVVKMLSIEFACLIPVGASNRYLCCPAPLHVWWLLAVHVSPQNDKVYRADSDDMSNDGKAGWTQL